jgi:hypothetical protein
MWCPYVPKKIECKILMFVSTMLRGCNVFSSTFALQLYVGFRFFTLHVAIFLNLLLIIAKIPKLCREPQIHISPKTAKDSTNLVLGFEYQSAYQCCTFRVAISLGINLVMITGSSCTHFLIFNLHLTFSWVMLVVPLLNLFEHVSCCFMFSMAGIWFSYLNPNWLGYAQHRVDETLKNQL